MAIASSASVSPARRRRGASVTAGCGICEAMHGAAHDYVVGSLCDAEHLQANAEAIADAVGFCARHAACIADFEDGAGPIAAVLRRALAAVSALFDDRPGMGDRLKEVLFAAPDACPACAFVERRLTALLARHAARLRVRDKNGGSVLCLPHFDGLIGESELDDLPRWAAMEAACLADAGAALDGGDPGALVAATRLIAGRRPADTAVALAGHCRVCEPTSAARRRWLMLVRESVRTDAAPEMLLPLCGEHIWLCHASGDARIAGLATRNALEVSVRRLRRAAAKLQDEERRLERSKTSVWYRAKNPAYILGQRRRVVTDTPRCPACERVAIARDRAVLQLLEQLRDRRAREAIEHDGGLCMKHFAYARVIAPAGTVRDALTKAQIKELLALRDRLDASQGDAWTRVLAFLSGQWSA